MTHLYTAKHQPATRYRVFFDTNKRGKRWIITHKPRAHGWCRKCRRGRWYANLTVQVYYDGLRFWCRKGKGCAKP